MNTNILHKWLLQHLRDFHSVVSFNPEKEKLVPLDFTENNKTLQQIDFTDTPVFCKYINDILKDNDAKFGIGGYDELRVLYSRSSLFNDDTDPKTSGTEEPRRLHLGIDIWGKEGTEIFAPLDGTIHSFAFNNNFGDYGATIILKHQLAAIHFFTLYGHLSLADLKNISEGNEINNGELFAHFGKPEENGNWPPHLHFQVIKDIENYKGDYLGVCKSSEREKYISNCPDANLILNMNRFL